MKRIVNLLLLLALSVTALLSQEVTNGVLISWSGATGAITIPDEVTEIAANCFFTPGEDDPSGWGSSDPVSNTNITSVNLNNVVTVGDNAFKGCLGITSIKAPKLEKVGRESFEGCSALTALELPAIKTIGEKAFANTTALERVALGSSLSSVVLNPFENTLKLTEITLPESSTNYMARQGALIARADGTLQVLAGGVSEVSIGEECKAIGDNATLNCKNLVKLELPYVKTVGKNAFVNGSKLEELYLPRLERIEQNYLSFSGVAALRIVDIHLSESVSELKTLWPNKETTTVYVANETVKAELSKQLSKCQFVIGAPTGTHQRYTVTYSSNEGGVLEAWTTGSVDVESGAQLPEHAVVNFKAIPRNEMRVKEWRLNGAVITEGIQTEGINGEMYTISDLTSDVRVEVTFEARPEGYDIFFRSRASQMGSLTCRLDDGTEVTSGDRVPLGSWLNFTATPKEGYRIGDWFEEEEVASGKYKPIAGQNGKSTYRCEARDMLDIQVDFDRLEGTYVVKFSSFNEKTGTLTATADGKPINSGGTVQKGSKVVFTAHPAEGYAVDEWQLNGNTIAGYRALTYTIESLKEDVEVNMVCSQPTVIDQKPLITDGVLYKWRPVGEALLPSEVTYIAPLAFEGANQMTSLTLNDKVQAVGDRAFLYCVALEKFVVPEANGSFSALDGVLYSKDQTRLIAYPAGRKASSYTIPASVATMQPGAFVTAPRLSAVNVDAANSVLKSIDGALYTSAGATLLFLPTSDLSRVEGKLALPNGVERIARLAIAYHPTIKEITMPASLKAIDAMALSYNAAMKRFVWAEGVTPQVVSVGDSAFYYDRSLELIPYMESCSSFGKAAFGLATALKEIHIPEGCTVAANSFMGCQTISAVYSYSVEPPVIHESTFADIVYPKEATLYVQVGAKEAYSKAKGWNIFGHIEEQDHLSIATVDGTSLVLYPNPTQAQLQIAGAAAECDVLLYDLTGRLVGTTRTDATGSATMHLGELPAGSYIVRIAGIDRLVVKQ